jgi:hypothetical protein
MRTILLLSLSFTLFFANVNAQNSDFFSVKKVETAATFSASTSMQLVLSTGTNFYLTAHNDNDGYYYIQKYVDGTWVKLDRTFSDNDYNRSYSNFHADTKGNLYFYTKTIAGENSIFQFNGDTWNNLTLQGLPNEILSTFHAVGEKIYVMNFDASNNSTLYTFENDAWKVVGNANFTTGNVSAVSILNYNNTLLLKFEAYKNLKGVMYILENNTWTLWKKAYVGGKEMIRNNQYINNNANLAVYFSAFSGDQKANILTLEKDKWTSIVDDEIKNTAVRFMYVFSLKGKLFYFYENKNDNLNLYYKVCENGKWSAAQRFNTEERLGQISYGIVGDKIVMSTCEPNGSKMAYFELKVN